MTTIVTKIFEDGDDDALQRCVQADSMAHVLYDFDQWLRSQIKYSDKEYDDVRIELHDLCDAHGVTVDSLWS